MKPSAITAPVAAQSTLYVNAAESMNYTTINWAHIPEARPMQLWQQQRNALISCHDSSKTTCAQ
jgi:hypothetical protein